jgi:hypothetical protein
MLDVSEPTIAELQEAWDRDALRACRKAIDRVQKNPGLEFEVGFFAVEGLVGAFERLLKATEKVDG